MVSIPSDDDPDGNTAGPHSSRRTLLMASAGALGVGVAASVLGPVAVFLGHPLRHDTTEGEGDFIAAGPPSMFGGDKPVKVDLYADRVDAWNRVLNVKVGSAWVLSQGGQLVALSTVCPHLGCGIDYDAAASKFYCACHKSWFSMDGAVESGPSPRGMDALEVKAEEQLVSIRFQRFKMGTKTQEPA
ncbi:MAG: Rieske 2Fe-2S domain-containing protein [Deltaproteobacteria bacterium]|nr:Rieske 2Fe-2S domain-containing protein [Deltaproteobacteria bacterium]MBK8239529.1 Rieske 2Fe-2S domain-containing protein [Deltaproteobacteria bacterium]MBK8719326.1 Rieske 2Fe-2S domain-containing protein [Deltaproteobacteria bacterium]MBP7291828.1 Rieske 2Fe-2S domain-containing protein [Nannocystaceae bacterium]